MDLRKAEKCKTTIFILLDETFFLYSVTKKIQQFLYSLKYYKNKWGCLDVIRKEFDISFVYTWTNYFDNDDFLRIHRLETQKPNVAIHPWPTSIMLLMFEVGFYITWQGMLSVSMNVQFCSIHMLQFQLFTFCTTDINTKSIRSGNGSNLSFCPSRKWSKSFDIYLQVL